MKSFEFLPQNFSVGPGVYLMKDEKGRIIYVGKAKSLRKRLASYFGSVGKLTPKTHLMVRRIAAVDTLSTVSEKEALLLEASLIKKHKPRYNIVLRDDKSYILFKLTKGHDFPRLETTRRVVDDGSVYFGPFTSAGKARQAAEAVGRIFILRKCRDHVFKNRVRPCLYHHIKECHAPCVGYITKEDYAELVREVELFFQGRSKELTADLHKRMMQASAQMDYEEAAALRDRIKAVNVTLEKQVALLPSEKDLDAVACAAGDRGLALSVLFVRKGRLLDKKTFFWPGLTLEDAGEAVGGFLNQFYTATRLIPETILMPWPPDESDDKDLIESLAERRGGRITLRAPRTGDEKKLIEMARTNAAQDMALRSKEKPLDELLERALKLPGPAVHIEAVDVSHLRGTGTRVGRVVFEEGRPVPDLYRTYVFPELEGTSDDYAALAAWAERRLAKGPPWPDLVLIDGGRGQLGAVERIMKEEGMEGVWPSRAIAKSEGEAGKGPDRRAGALEDRIFAPGRKNPLNLKAGGTELLFLQRVRDAAHEYVIGRQRRSRSKDMLQSEVAAIPGVGPKTAKLLWDAFGTLEAMRAASLEDLQQVPGLGKKRAEKIWGALKGEG